LNKSKMINYKENAFSLLGVIVAIFIFSVGLVGISVLASYSLNVANSNKMSIIASMLAQEGIEKIRDIRQMNATWGDWDWYAIKGDGDSEDYQIQYDTDTLSPMGALLPLRKHPITGVYSHDDISSDLTPFTRVVTLTKISANEVGVIVEVKWKDRDKEKSLMAEDRLWNWK